MRLGNTRVLKVVVVVVATFALSLVIPVFAQAAEYAKQAVCAACHKTKQGDVGPVTQDWDQTKHAKATGDDPRHSVNGEPGVGCQACHGPGLAHVKAGKDEKKGSSANPADIPTREGRLSLCVRCHAQYEEGFVQNYAFGDNILDKIALKAPTGGVQEQLNEMKDSKHFTDLKAPTCIDCHTGHKGLDPALAPQLIKAVNDLCVGCHDPAKNETRCKHEVPAGGTCATCHMPNKKHVFKVAAQ